MPYHKTYYNMTQHNSYKCNAMVCAHCFDLSVVTDSINGNSIQ